MAQTETATLGGGCFWCVEAVYQRVKGIESVKPGYAGGQVKNPTYKEIYPFSKIVGNANVLIMPALHSAAISTKLMKVFGGGKNIGPLLIGLGQPIEVAPLRASTSEILNLASIAAYSSDVIDYSN